MAWKDKVVEDSQRRYTKLDLGIEGFRRNRVLDTDSYKASHPFQYPEDLTGLSAYMVSRGGRYATTVWFGLQPLVIDTFSNPIGEDEVKEAEAFCAQHGEPFPLEGWMRVLDRHEGFVPLRIRALPEGSVVPTGVPLMVVDSMDPELPWLVSWFETQLVRGTWYPTTVATKDYYCKKVIFEALQESAEDPVAELPFKLHDFGARGVSSWSSGCVGGAAHLVNFSGSDTMEAVRYANYYYDCAMAGFSIPAAEHSTMVLEGRDGEIECMRRMLRAFAKPGALLSCVSDGYDIFNAVENIWCGELLEEVKASGAKVVVRPDSGDPAAVNTELCRIFDRKGQMRKNRKGYKVLEPYFGLIQGDGNNDEGDIQAVLSSLLQAGYSASNIAFGMGGGLLQQVTRDTQRFKYMTSLARYRDGREVPVFKDPVTDSGKRSQAGIVDTVFRDGRYQLALGNQRDSALELVYEGNGKLCRLEKLADVRKRAEAGLF